MSDGITDGYREAEAESRMEHLRPFEMAEQYVKDLKENAVHVAGNQARHMMGLIVSLIRQRDAMVLLVRNATVFTFPLAEIRWLGREAERDPGKWKVVIYTDDTRNTVTREVIVDSLPNAFWQATIRDEKGVDRTRGVVGAWYYLKDLTELMLPW